MNRTRLWFFRCAMILAALAFSLLVAEGLIRLFGPTHYSKPMLTLPGKKERIPLSEIAHFLRTTEPAERVGPGAGMQPGLAVKGWYDRPEWDYFDDEDCIEYRTNRFGFRDDEFDLEKPSGQYRILAVGDSFTFGTGVQHEIVWTEQLEARLEQAMGKPVQVINGGFACGHMPALYADWIAGDGLAFDPDMVIIGLCLNDMDIRIPMVAYHLGKPRPLLGGYSKLLYELQRFLMRFRKFKDDSKDYAALVRNEPEVWEENKRKMSELGRYLDGKGIRLVVVILPMLSCLQGDYPFRGLHDIARSFCEEEGIECIDLMDRFLGHDERDLWVHPTDQHPNHIGHAMIADEIFGYLQKTE